MTTSDAWSEAWDEVADVVVVGTGASGMAAGITAAVRGASVIVLEKTGFIGGTTAKSGGTVWLPNNSLMERAGLRDDRDAALRYLARVAYPTVYDAGSPCLGVPEAKYRLLEALYDHGREAFDSLAAVGALPYDEGSVELAYPDYHADLPEDAAPVGRSIFMRLPDGHRRGVDATGGQLMVEQMGRVAEAHGARILLDHRVVHLIRNDDAEVVGVEVRAGKRTVLIGARRGVVFGSGGFLHDEELRAAFLRGRLFGGAAADSATGDFVRIGLEVGAQLGNMTEAWWDEVALELVLRAPSTIEDVWCPFGDSMIVVNRYGHRVMNEKMPYSERGHVHFNWDVARREYPNLLLFMIYDDAVARSEPVTPVRYPVPRPGEPHDHVISGGTWAELTDAIRQRLAELAPHLGGFQLDESFPDGLARSVARFDELAAGGVDLDHHRGETPIEQRWAVPPRPGAANATMYPFASNGPYHCIILAAGALDTKGGPMIDECGRVLGVDGVPIAGLFGAGNCIASPTGHAYWGPGATIGPALTFGYLAGATAAQTAVHAPPGFEGDV